MFVPCVAETRLSKIHHEPGVEVRRSLPRVLIPNNVVIRRVMDNIHGNREQGVSASSPICAGTVWFVAVAAVGAA